MKTADTRKTTCRDVDTETLLETIYRSYHYDFRNYSRASLQRLLTQASPRFGCRTLAELRERVADDPVIFSRLLDCLTVQFSDMFRDPSYFKSLRHVVLPILRTYPSVKVWCAGCASGEEAYSLAILFREEGLLKRTTIYATDINGQALRKAEAGIYAMDRIPGFSRNYQQTGATASLAEYYTAAYGGAVLDRDLKRKIVFADHSLATDAVFSEVHFISCRNVLIYFDRELQSRSFEMFYEALCPRGFLGLGARENLRSDKRCMERFQPMVSDDRIYRKVGEPNRRMPLV